MSNRSNRTLYCTNCGSEINDAMRFCPKCGAPLDATRRPSRTRARETKEPNVWGFVSVGIILVLLALTYLRFPIDPSVFINYFRSLADLHTFIKPPQTLLDPVIFFLYAAGIWRVLLSGLLMVFQRSVRKALETVMGGLFFIFLAFLLTNYAVAVFTGRITLGYFIIAIGFLVIAYTIIHFAVPVKSRND